MSFSASTSCALSAAALAWLSGCTFLLDWEREQCMVADDCGPELECDKGLCVTADLADWTCLGVSRPFPDEAFEMSLAVLDEVNDLPVIGAVVKVCEQLDTMCDTPAAREVTDDSGLVTLQVSNREQYFELTADGYKPMIVMGLNALDLAFEDPPLRVETCIIPTDAYDALTSFASITPIDTHGDVEVLARECNAEDAGGVRFAFTGVAMESSVLYVVNDIPSSLATETTAIDGTAFVFNAPGPLVTAAGRVIALDLPISDTPANGVVRAGWFTRVSVAPDGVRIDDALREP